jgi:hypothetical protein
MTNTLAYNETSTIMAVKGFIVQALGLVYSFQIVEKMEELSVLK